MRYTDTRGRGLLQVSLATARFNFSHFVVGKDGRAILRPHIRPLPVQSGGIVNREEHPEQVTIGNDIRIEGHLADLGVAGAPGADVLVRRVGHRAAGVSGDDTLHALQVIEDGLQAPETPARQRRDFRSHVVPARSFPALTLDDNRSCKLWIRSYGWSIGSRMATGIRRDARGWWAAEALYV